MMDIEKNYNAYNKSLIAYIGDEFAAKIVEKLGENNIKNAVFGNTSNSGVAYEGSFTETVINFVKMALSLNSLLPEYMQVEKKSLVKVCLLCHLSKVVMFEPNDNSWEKTNRGILFKFTDFPYALRTGERSLQMATSMGITFNESEFEAMRIIDKDVSSDNYTAMYSSILSSIVSQANEMIMLINKNKKDESKN